LEALEYVSTTYNAAGFRIKEIHCDREFASMQEELERRLAVLVNLTAAQEHQPDVERTIRTIEERYRAMYHRCPFKMWPKLMVIRGASEAVKWLTLFHQQEACQHNTVRGPSFSDGRLHMIPIVRSALGVLCKPTPE
jgi:hypothetical protein